MGIKSRFCARCGKITDELQTGLCPACYLEENPIRAPRTLAIKVCSKCGAALWKGVWLRSEKPPEFYLKQLIASKLALPKDVELAGIEITETGKQGRATITLKVLNQPIKKHAKISMAINKFACPSCSRQHADWVVKLQVRTAPINDVLALASKYRERIVKTEQQRGGVDIFFFNRSAANKLANRLKKQFNLTLRKSYEQHGHDFDVGQPIHRETISLR